MSLIDKTIPGLYNGVSQQPLEFIRDTQCLEQLNGYGTIVGGLRKRPPLQFLEEDLDGDGDPELEELSDAFYHTYDRGRTGTSLTEDAYIVAVTTKGSIRVWNVNGDEQLVHMYTDVAKTNLVTTHPYLNSGTFETSKLFRAATVADGTFIVNTSVPTAFTTDVSQGTSKNMYTYWIKKVFDNGNNAGWQYTLDSVTVGGTNNDGSNDSATVLSLLDTGLTDVNWVPYNPYMVYEAPEATFKTNFPNGVVATDSSGGSATSAWFSEVTSITQLPAGGIPNVTNYDPVIKVQGIDKGDDSYYYVKREGEAWHETIGFNDDGSGLNYKLDATTMPHILKKVLIEDDGTGVTDTTITTAAYTLGDLVIDSVSGVVYKVRIATTTIGDSLLDDTKFVPTHFGFYPADSAERIVGDNTTTPDPSFVGKTLSDIFMFNDRLGVVSEDAVVLSETSNYTNFFATTSRSYPDTDPIDLKIDSTQVLYIDYVISYAKELMLFTKEGQYVLKGQQGLVTPTTVSITKVTSYPFSASCRPMATDSSVLFTSKLGAFGNVYEYNVQQLGTTYEGTNVTDHVPSYIPTGIRKMASISAVKTIVALPDETTNELYVYNYYLDGKGNKVQSAWSKWTFDGNIVDIFTLDNYLYISKYKTTTGTTKTLGRIDLSITANPLDIDYRDEADATTKVDYEFRYKFKNWRMDATESGIDNSRGRLVFRTLQLNSNEGSVFDVTVTRAGATKILGAQELKDGKVLIGSKAEGVDIVLTNTTQTGLQLNTVSFEGTYYTRSRNLKGR